MAGGRELLDFMSGKVIASLHVLETDETDLLGLGRQVVAWQMQALQGLYDDMKFDGLYATHLDYQLVGEGNGGVDAKAIVSGGIAQCQNVLSAYAEGNFEPLFTYAQAEMQRQAVVFDRVIEDEQHAALLPNPNWRVDHELGTRKVGALRQWVFWFQIHGLNQPES